MNVIASRWMCALALAFGLAGCDQDEPTEAPPQAADHEEAETETGEQHEDPDLEFDETPADDDGGGSSHDPAVVAVHEDVTKAFNALQADRLDVDKARADLEAAKGELASRLDELGALEKRLDERLGAGDVSRKRRDKRIGVLAKLILAMPPQAAAQMVAQMSDADAQAIVLAMSGQNERKASKLLAAMPGDRAASLGQLYLDHDPKTLVDDTGAPPTTPKAGAPQAAPPSAAPATPQAPAEPS